MSPFLALHAVAAERGEGLLPELLVALRRHEENRLETTPQGSRLLTAGHTRMAVCLPTSIRGLSLRRRLDISRERRASACDATDYCKRIRCRKHRRSRACALLPVASRHWRWSAHSPTHTGRVDSESCCRHGADEHLLVLADNLRDLAAGVSASIDVQCPGRKGCRRPHERGRQNCSAEGSTS